MHSADIMERRREHVAYFTMEAGISSTIPSYAGGLGILAGDTLKSFADLSYPVIGVTLLNEKGYFRQRIDEHGNQVEGPVEWNVCDFMVPLPNEVIISIADRQVRVRAWLHIIHGLAGHNNPMIFLDTDCPENSAEDRKLTHHLYGGDRRYRLSQEIVLGVGGARMLDSLGYTIRKYHLNEGHAALLGVELLRKASHRERDFERLLDKVRRRCVFTTHTPVAAGHDRFDAALFQELLRNFVPEELTVRAMDNGQVNMTLLALELSHYVNGVALRHRQVTKRMFPEYQIDSITNGVHAATWASPHMKLLFDKHIPGWSNDPFTLRSAIAVAKEDIWEAHQAAKRDLIELINEQTNLGFDVSRFTIGYARRFTAYKRPDLILHDLERLKALAEQHGDIQIVFSGKAHSQDTTGKELLRTIITTAEAVNAAGGRLKIAFLEHYDMRLALHLVSGCDVWLNTPQRPQEASGTSGMKAAINGVPHLSTIDGWWMEGRIEGETGWSIGAHPHDDGFEEDYDAAKDANDLYNQLARIIPIFYGDRKRWSEIMRHCIAINGSFFNSHRMAQQYITNAYRE